MSKEGVANAFHLLYLRPMKIFWISVVLLYSLSLQAQTKRSKYSVFYFLGEDCRICEYYAPEINRLDSLYSGEEFQFQGFFPSRYSTEKGIEAFKEKYKIQIPLKLEYFATKTKSFGVTITPEVVVYNNESEKIIYRGRIDDSYVRVGRRRRVIQERDLESLLHQLISGEEPEYIETQAIGCYITFR